MNIYIHPNDRYPIHEVKRIFTSAVARKGYNIMTIVGRNNESYKVQGLKQLDQDLLKTLVIKECEHYGLDYEITD